jgi:ABC-type transport system involved in multi-copper enzyme maturation permease subunit
VSALLQSELLKIRTIRSWWAYLVVIVLFTGIAVAGDIGSTDADRSTVDFQLGLVDTAGIALLLAIILGITIITTEFRFGTVTPTFLAAPHRELVVAAKAMAGVVVAIGFALLSLVIVVAVALPWLAIVDAEAHLGDGEIGTRAAQQILSAVLWALMGVAIGTVVQSQVAALVGTLVWIFLGETLLIGFFGLINIDGAAGYLPFQALDAADGTGGGDLLSYWPGVAVSLGWVALLGAVGIVRTRRRDIT